MKFRSKKPSFEYLRKKWLLKHKSLQEKLWEKHGEPLRKIAFGGIGGLMLMTSPYSQQIPTQNLFASRDDVIKDIDRNIVLAQQLSDDMPDEVRPLESNEEKVILDKLSENFGFKVAADIEGIRLNRNYGLIGAEQHLYRYPGDTLQAHADTTSDWAMYGGAGIAPGLGAWGYFASSKDEFSETDKLRERYYLAIQTFLAPGFAENVGRYRDFFKFRKMIVVNPNTGQAVVAVIGDAGPAEWTGKHLGGSPEVMHDLGYGGGPRKGPVLYFFVDDPSNEIPLGPVKIQSKA